MKKPILSVIIPVYNAIDTINRCIESVLCQTFNDIEIVIIDDCSTDKSLDIINSYQKKDNRIVVLKNSENIGVGASRNKALKEACGKYVGFVDNDDWVEPDYFEKMVSKLEETGYDVCVSLKIENHTGEKTKTHLLIPKNLKEIVFVNRTAPWAKVIRREFLVSNNIQFSLTRGEDIYPAFLCAYLTDKITFIKDSKYHCTIRHGSISHSKIKEKDLEEIRLYEKIKDKIEDDKFWCKILKERALITLDFLYPNADFEMKKKILFEYKKVFKSCAPLLDYFIWKILINFKRIKTLLNARFSG